MDVHSHTPAPNPPAPPAGTPLATAAPPVPALTPISLPTLAQAFTLYGLIIFLFIAQGIVLVLRQPSDLGMSASTDPLVLLLTQLLFLVAPTLVWWRLFRWDFARTFRLRAVPTRVLFYTAVASLAFIPLAQEVEALVQQVLPVPPFMEQVFRELLTAHGAGDMLLTLTTVAIIPGFIEEGLFRGVFLWALLRHLPPKRAIFASALFFAIMHFNPWQFVGGLVLGSIYGAIALWTGSLVPTMLAHMINNGVFVVMMNVMPQATEPATSTPARLVLDLAGAVLSILCLVRIRQLGAGDTREAGTAPHESPA